MISGRRSVQVSVVLATFRRVDTLQRTLTSFCTLQTGALEWQLIVVDNAGDARTAALVEGFRSRLPVEFLVETCPGKNSALNAAVAHVRGELVVFCDDDIEADPAWLKEVWAGAGRWPSAGVFGGRILPRFPPGPVPYDLAREWIIRALVVADWPQPEGGIPHYRVYGPNMAVRAALFQAGHRFDPGIGPRGANYAMGSEAEFTMRLSRAGVECVYLPGALVHHLIRPEQMKPRWLADRAYRAGRGEALLGTMPRGRLLAGVPRGLYLQCLSLWARMARRAIHGARDDYLDAMQDYWFLRGRIHEYRRINLQAHARARTT